MSRGVRWYLVGSGAALGALVALAGCSTHWLAQREPWRHEAEVACLNSGAVHEGAEKVRISPINGPGMCGADFPIKVSGLGDTAPIGYDEESMRPPGSIPNGASMPQRWPGASQNSPPQPQYSAPVDTRPLPRRQSADDGAVSSRHRARATAHSRRPISRATRRRPRGCWRSRVRRSR